MKAFTPLKSKATYLHLQVDPPLPDSELTALKGQFRTDCGLVHRGPYKARPLMLRTLYRVSRSQASKAFLAFRPLWALYKAGH